MILANHGIVSSSGGLPPSTLNNNIISMYKGESNVNDSLLAYNGTSYGGLTYTTGKSGNALSFNGTTSYVDMGDSFDIGTSSWTYAFWFKTTNAASNGVLFSKALAGGVVGRLWVQNTSNRVYFNFQADSGNVITLETDLAIINNNTWYHVACIIDRADKLKMYIDGVVPQLRVSAGTNNLIPYVSTNYNTSTTFKFGAFTQGDNVTPAPSWNGLIDEFGVWNRVLTQSEITELQTKYYPY